MSNNTEKEIEDTKKNFAQNLLFFRKKLNISQKELADKISTTNKNISKWERAETIPDIFTMKKLASTYSVSIDTLVNPLSKDNIQAISTKKSTPMRWNYYFLMLVNAVIFLLTCIAFFILKFTKFDNFNPFFVFIYMIPLMDLSIFIFICIVYKKVDAISLSFFGWITTICIYLYFIDYTTVGYIFMVTIAYQIIVPIFAELINSRRIIKLNKLLLSKWKKQGATEKDSEQESNKTNEIQK